jgi:hypothetical protein
LQVPLKAPRRLFRNPTATCRSSGTGSLTVAARKRSGCCRGSEVAVCERGPELRCRLSLAPLPGEVASVRYFVSEPRP